MVTPCGLLSDKQEPVPLKSVSVSLSINEFVTSVSATLNYENEQKVPLEAAFIFPMDEDSAVYSFEALVDGKRVVAELQDKAKAHTNYENAISQGHQAFLLEEDVSSRDVFSCNVGNLQPGAKVALTLRYVQELSLEADGALRFVLPTVLNPRYQLSGCSQDSCLNRKIPIVPLKDVPYTLSMVATITSQHGIEKIQSNCPLSPTEYLGDDKTSAQVSLAEGHKYDRDVELLIYYNEVHAPSVAVEMGLPKMKPGCFLGDPSAMVSFYPNIPEDKSPNTCGEFIFLMDRSGSMESPLSSQSKSQPRIEAAKKTLILLLKSLPVGCYFNIYGFGSTYEAFFQESVKYTQQTMKEALGRVKRIQADLGGTEILAPLQNIYKAPSIPGHPLQLFVFTDGEVSDTFTVIKEVKINRQKHRCFSFGIGEGASTSLIKGIALASGGTSEFITGKDRMQSKALRTLKHSLQPVVGDVSVSWDLPPGLSVKILSPEPTVIFKGQRLIIYAQLTGVMPPAETTGKVCLKYALQGKSFEDKVTFSLQPKPDANLTIHRLAAKSFIQTKDMGLTETPASHKSEVLNISLESGVISSFTAFIAVNKELNKPVQGPLTYMDIPRPFLRPHSQVFPKSMCSPRNRSMCFPVYNECMTYMEEGCRGRSWINENSRQGLGGNLFEKHQAEDDRENHLIQLIALQNANGSWDLNEDLAKALDMSLEDITAVHPTELVDSSGWATILAVIWLHTNVNDLKCEWDLLERKAVAWVRIHAGRSTILRPVSFPSRRPAIFPERVSLSPSSTTLVQAYSGLAASSSLGRMSVES
ncbi:von Willebrand factor A domain-containing protein 5A-like isoform X4 [Microcebus murinus]|uniref:von Willebrand factor A domain-containing protein 5A-like isoform X4 n=1 Tax=Microcebus murinus TaxID=30608 RepID=UPI003F6CB671